MTPQEPPQPPSRVGRLIRSLGPRWLNLVLTLVTTACAAGLMAAVVLLADNGSPLVAAVVAGATCALVAPWVNSLVLRMALDLSAARRELALRSTKDELTGVHDRRHFMTLAEAEIARCRRYQTAGALLLVDADHFKRINDTHGHLCGDAMLCAIARATQGSLRQPDVLARFGGEELAVFLPHADPLGAIDVADRIRERVAELRLTWEGAEVRTTVSIGVASLDAAGSLDALIHDADTALFAAKEAGRNCVRAAPIQPRRNGETHPATSKR